MNSSTKTRQLFLVAGSAGVGVVYSERLLGTLECEGELTFIGWNRQSSCAIPWPYQAKREYLQSGGGYRNLGLVFHYAKWPILVARRFWNVGSHSVVLALDLDSAIGAAVAQRRTGFHLLYFMLDNFALRPAVPRIIRPIVQFADRFVIGKSHAVIVPDESRILVGDSQRGKFVVVRNSAVDISHDVPAAELELDLGRPLTVYASGYLAKSRGIGLLLDVAQRMPALRVRLAGTAIDQDLIVRAKGLANVSYLGRLSYRDSLRECYAAHLIFAMYDPIEPLNRLAASNKWSDAMMASRPILTNSEIKTASFVRECDVGYTIAYGDVRGLRELLEGIDRNRQGLVIKGRNGRALYEREWSWEQSKKKIIQLVRNCYA